MSSVRRLRERKGYHCEVEGCVVNIREGLIDLKGRKVTSIEIIPDNYAGDKWKRIGACGNVRVIKLKGKR